MISWIILAIAAAICWAVVNVNDKYIISKLNIPPIVAMIGTGIVGLLSAVIVSLIKGFEPLSFFHTTLALLGGVFFMLMIILYLEAAKREEISRIIPIFGLSPLFILIIARFWFNEVLTKPQYLGILLLVIGSVVISSKRIGKFKITTASILMIFSAFAWAMHQLITDYLTQYHEFWNVFSYIRLGAFIIIVPELIYYTSSIKKLYRKKGPKPFVLLGTSEALYVFGVLLATIATSRGLVSLVNGILSIQPMFVLFITVLLSIFLPKIMRERNNREAVATKSGSILLIIIGTILIS